MLTKLIERFDVSSAPSSSPSIVREQPGEEMFEDENENEHEQP
jgi:hypothetical protein